MGSRENERDELQRESGDESVREWEWKFGLPVTSTLCKGDRRPGVGVPDNSLLCMKWYVKQSR